MCCLFSVVLHNADVMIPWRRMCWRQLCIWTVGVGVIWGNLPWRGQSPPVVRHWKCVGILWRNKWIWKCESLTLWHCDVGVWDIACGVVVWSGKGFGAESVEMQPVYTMTQTELHCKFLIQWFHWVWLTHNYKLVPEETRSPVCSWLTSVP